MRDLFPYLQARSTNELLHFGYALFLAIHDKFPTALTGSSIEFIKYHMKRRLEGVLATTKKA
jgi:hypothetical protein